MTTIYAQGKKLENVIEDIKKLPADEQIRFVYPDSKESTKTQVELLKELEELV